jgi:2-polyprenyl-3-methyl-5-hydroxy-6-metoxy-1,4-benzoquinol methylase
VPIDHKNSSTYLSQREQYQKGGVGRRYWDFRDNNMFGFIKDEHKNIVDLGCGEGITLEKLVNRYPDRNVMGIDVVDENVEICRQHGLPVSPGSVYDLKIEKETVDMCVFSEVIEHLDDPVYWRYKI